MNEKKAAYVPAGQGSMENAEIAYMSKADRLALEQAGKDWSAAHQAGDEKGQAEAHRRAEEIRGRYGYSGGADGSEYISTQKGPDFVGMLNQWLEDAKKHQEAAADHAVEQGVSQLEQAQKEAEERFQVRQDQVEREERNALDNHALYMEARGDRGGIGHAQHGSIQAQAMRDRQEVNQARMDLASDTAQKIADLRAQGEFQKADALMSLTQDYLGRLTSIYQWQQEQQLDEDKFKAQLEQWNREFEIKVAEMMGSYQDKPTLEAQKYEKENERYEQQAQREKQELLVKLGLAALEQGIRPSPSQQQALGWSDSQVNQMLQHYRDRLNGGKGSGGKGGSGSRPKPNKDVNDYELIDQKMPQNLKGLDVYQKLYAVGCRGKSDAFYYLVHTVGVSDQTARSLAGYFDDKMETGSLEKWWEAYQSIPTQPIGNVNGGQGVDRWVYVPGAGRVSTKELNAMLAKGQITKRVDSKTGKVYYSAKRK